MLTGENLSLGAMLLLELANRGFRRPPWKTWVDAGYCLDAPMFMAAGSHIRDEFGPEADDWIPMTTFVERADE